VKWTRAVLALALAACGAGNPSSPPADSTGYDVEAAQRSRVYSVTVSPASDSLVVGEETRLSAVVRDERGRILSRTVTWASGNPSVATVTAEGVVRAVAVGPATVTASVGGKTGSASIVVAAAPISSVTISPDPASLTVGATQQMAAVVRDSGGSVVTGASVIWDSSNDSIATVSASGTVTALVAGSVTVLARAGTVSGRASVSVTSSVAPPPPPPPPPPPSSSGSNEPAGFTLISERSFGAKVEHGWTDRGDANFTIEMSSTAPEGLTIGQALYPAGFAGGSGPILTERAVPGGMHQLYLRIWVRFSPNWVGHSTGINKVIFFFIHGQPSVFLNAQGSGSGPLVPLILTQAAPGLPAPNYPNDRLPANVNPGVTLNRGQWHKWEVLLVANTPGQFNGTARWWIDGVLVGNHTNVAFSDAGQANTWELVRWNPTWGGAGGSVPANMTMQMDWVRISALQ